MDPSCERRVGSTPQTERILIELLRESWLIALFPNHASAKHAQCERNQIFPFGHLQSPQSCAKRDQDEADHNVASLAFNQSCESIHGYLKR